MACPTCDHTMQQTYGGLFWCPRCGTIKTDLSGDCVPALVERCRTFEQKVLSVDDGPVAVDEWTRLGITESINTPDNR